ncbi:hypothetical protein [Marinoscillum luteum]|uniref:Peptidase S74 domain-containing protein n=1 Tax=Marinoscillum luteum TaxID=861051 RepID=A0ABW7ND21_9BACT
MNKLSLLVISIFTYSLSYSQVTDTGDKVGIGQTNPSSKLDVYRNSGNETIATFGTNEGSINIAAAGSSTENPTYINYISSRNANNTAYEDFAIKTGGGVGQFLIKTNGNIGIGESSPQAMVHIKQSASGLTPTNVSGGMYIENSGSSNTHYVFQTATSGGGKSFSITNAGNVGIGTTSPNYQFEIFEGDGKETVAQFRTNEGIIGIAAAGNSTENPTYGNYISSRNASNTAYEDFGFKTSSGIPQLLIKTNGSVGIGTNNTGTHKLSVNGSIRSKEVKVEANWSDFVFYDDYELRTLEEVEQHINENGHLPEIPSEAEVTENGINLGEMNAKLLQKIEELTLYLIEQNKEINELKEKVSSLENK